jgi:hypothetical protein
MAEAKEAFTKVILQEAREETAPASFLFSSPSLVRSPWLWLLAFEERNVASSHFLTPDGTRGELARSFLECAHKVFSGRDEPPYIAPEALSSDLEVLTAQFSALGTLFARVPVPSDTDARRAALEMVVILRPSVEAAEATLRRITATFVSHLGGSREKYLVARHLDPLHFAACDREALRKATVRPEALTLDRRRERGAGGLEQQTCRRCGKTFSGVWRDHARRNCTRRTEAVKAKE